MAYRTTENRLGIQDIQTGAPTAQHALGEIVRAYDPVSGGAEFIYLLSVSGQTAGSLVSYGGNATGTPTYQAALCLANASQGWPMAVAMFAASASNSFGWYCVEGAVPIGTNGTLAAGPGRVYIAGTGSVTSTNAAGVELVNCVNQTATGTPAANLAMVYIMRPFAQGSII